MIRIVIGVYFFLLALTGSGQSDFFGSHSSINLNNGLIHYYTFDDTGATIADNAGSYNITNSGGTDGVTGVVNNCYQFGYDGVDKDDAESTINYVALSTRSISLWVKLITDPGSGDLYFFTDQGVSAGDRVGFFVRSSNSVLTAGYSRGANSFGAVLDATINTGVWYNITMIQYPSGNDLKNDIYLDGDYVTTQTGTSVWGDVIGRVENNQISFTSSVTNNYEFLIDDIKIWDRKLLFQEIRFNYNNGNGRAL